MKLSKILPRSPEKRNRVMGVILGMLVALAVSLSYSDWSANKPFLKWVYGQMHRMEYKAYDMRFKLRGPLPKKDIIQDIVLVDIDDESWEWAPWPFDRTLYAEMVRALGTPGSRTKATFYDVFFFDPSGPVLNVEMAKLFESEFGKLPPLVMEDQAIINDLKTGLYDTAGQLKGPIDPVVLAKAKAALTNLSAEPRLLKDIQDLNAVSTFMTENQSLETLAPDRDKVFHDAIQYAGNVYLAQIVSKKEPTPYDVNDILYDSRIHKIFGKLILLQDRTKTKSHTDVLVNYALRNMMVVDFERVMRETDPKAPADKTPNAKKAFKYNDKERAAIKEAMDDLVKRNMAAISVNKPFGVDIGKNAPVSRNKIFKNFINIVSMETSNPLIGEYVAGVGYVMPELQQDDGTIRAVAPAVVFEGRMYLHIDLMLAAKYLGIDNKKDILFYEDRIVMKNCKFPGRKKKESITIPLFEKGTMLVNWAGTYLEPNQFVHRSFRRVYEDAVKYNILTKQAKGEPLNLFEQQKLAAMTNKDIARVKKEIEFFNGKITLTGLTAADTHDLNPIPFHPRYPLVGMHGNLVNTIVNRLFIKTVPFWTLFLFIFGLSVVIGFTGG
ncbi:MAG: CHASE2 domain-containing protein, partial [bacterium]